MGAGVGGQLIFCVSYLEVIMLCTSITLMFGTCLECWQGSVGPK